MRELLIVSVICVLVVIGLGTTLAFWQIPVPISEKTMVISNDQFAK